MKLYSYHNKLTKQRDQIYLFQNEIVTNGVDYLNKKVIMFANIIGEPVPMFIRYRDYIALINENMPKPLKSS